MSAKVKKLVWLWVKRNGGNKDLRLLFSKRCAKRHFAFETQKLRFHRASMQYRCRENFALQPYKVHSEIECRVQKFAVCQCQQCVHRAASPLQNDKRLRMWMRYDIPLTY